MHKVVMYGQQLKGTAVFCLMQKIQAVKVALTRWAGQIKAERFRKVNQLLQDIGYIQSQMQTFLEMQTLPDE